MKDKITYYSIEFNEMDNTYFYTASENIYKTGDYVVVPVSDSKIEKIGKIVKIDYFTDSNAPIPLKEIKSIQRLCLPCEVQDYLSMIKTGKWAKTTISDTTDMTQTVSKKIYKPKTQTAYLPKKVSKGKRRKKFKSFFRKVFKGIGVFFSSLIKAGKTKPKRYRQKRSNYLKGVSYYPKNKNF